MKRSTERILTTHVGSLVRPPEIMQVLAGKRDSVPFDADQLAVIRRCVAEAVQKQAEAGIDIPSDGEYSKAGFSQYITDRLTGFELRPDLPGCGGIPRSRDRGRFPDAYREIDSSAQNAVASPGSAQHRMTSTVCASPIRYRGEQAVRADIDNLRAAIEGKGFADAFIPAVAPGTIELQRANRFYASEEEYLFAIADAMRTEYRTIVEAGFIVQIDDPRVVTEYDSMDPPPTPQEYRRFAALRVEALNHALAGLLEDRVRYHVCWGSWHGPHTTDIPLREIAPVLLGIRAGAFSIEAANPRHEHEYHIWEDLRFPEGKILIPGVIAHTTNCVEHPELVADRLMRFAKLVGRENIIAGVDCGFAQGAGTSRVHPQIMWEKFRMLAEGARLASLRLWS